MAVVTLNETAQCTNFFEQAIRTNLRYWLTAEAVRQQDMAALDTYQDSILRAINFGLQLPSEWETVAELVVNLTLYMYQRGLYQQWHEVNQPLLSQPFTNIELYLQLLEGHSRFLNRLGNYELAQEQAEQLIQLAQQHGDETFEMYGTYRLGDVYLHQGEYETARHHLQPVFEYTNNHHLPELRLGVLVSLSICYAYQRQGDKAVTLAEEGVTLAHQLGDVVQETYLLHTLGMLAGMRGDYVAGITAFEQFVREHEQVGNHFLAKNVYGNLGLSYWYLGVYPKAKEYLQGALTHYRNNGDVRSEALTLANLGLPGLADLETRQSYNQQALQLAETLGHKPIQADALTNLGHIHRNLADWTTAMAYYQRAMALREELNQPGQVIEIQACLAWISHQQGQTTAAETALSPVLAFLETAEVGDFDDPFELYLLCYQLLMAMGQPEAGQKLLQTAQAQLQAQATKISNPTLQQSYLAIPTHQALLAEL